MLTSKDKYKLITIILVIAAMIFLVYDGKTMHY